MLLYLAFVVTSLHVYNRSGTYRHLYRLLPIYTAWRSPGPHPPAFLDSLPRRLHMGTWIVDRCPFWMHDVYRTCTTNLPFHLPHTCRSTCWVVSPPFAFFLLLSCPLHATIHHTRSSTNRIFISRGFSQISNRLTPPPLPATRDRGWNPGGPPLQVPVDRRFLHEPFTIVPAQTANHA